MALLEDVKLSLGGIKHSKLDNEILDVIESAKAELKIGGAELKEGRSTRGALCKHAIKLYARAYFNYQGKGEEWRQAFDGLRDALALSQMDRGEADANK